MRHIINPIRFQRLSIAIRKPSHSIFNLNHKTTRVFHTHQSNMSQDAKKTEQEWRTVLSPEQFRILREKGTEPAGSGEYNKFYKDGTYLCAGCKAPLYKSTTKFDSGCGWPAFFEGIPGAIDRHEDTTFGMRRIEITCHNCQGHLGHVFLNEGFKTPTNERHCVNSVSLEFKE